MKFLNDGVKNKNNGLISKEEARRHYGIKSKSGILLWQRNYQKYGRFISFRITIEAGRDHRVQM